MNRLQHASPAITLRIPGGWSHPRELLERLPEGFRMRPESLCLPDGTEIESTLVPPDDQFVDVFQSACRRRPTDSELDVLGQYTVNVVLSGPGGSMQSARTMMQAASALIRAGAAGVFIDNSALAHGGEDWIDMAEDGGPDALSFAFVSIIRGAGEVNTMGMQVMGFPDLQMKTSDLDEHGDTLVELIRYMCGSERTVDVGHVLIDDQLRPRFHVASRENDEFEADSVMHNPYGRLKIVNAKDVAEGN